MRRVSLLDDGLRTGPVFGDEAVDLTDPLIGLPGSMPSWSALGAEAGEALVRAASTPGPS